MGRLGGVVWQQGGTPLQKQKSDTAAKAPRGGGARERNTAAAGRDRIDPFVHAIADRIRGARRSVLGGRRPPAAGPVYAVSKRGSGDPVANAQASLAIKGLEPYVGGADG